MPVIVKQPAPDLPYSLHDAYILEVRLEGDTLRLVTQYGYVETTEPFGQVQGDVEITGVDWDSSHAYVMEYRGVLCGNRGPFTVRKMAVEDFEDIPSGDAGHYGRDLRVPPGEAGRLSQPDRPLPGVSAGALL